MKNSVSVVIPTYNGLELLKKNLPTVIEAAKASSFQIEIIVVDDASTDDTSDFMQRSYSDVTFLQNKENLGFGETMNIGIRSARGSIVFALNNDVSVEKCLFEKSLQWFDDPTVFSVTPNMIDTRTGRCMTLTKLKASVCWFQTRFMQPSELPDLSGEIPIFFASGGGSFYDREKLLKLGGFDPIFSPFYVEDMDLSYQAWKSGWKCLWERDVTVHHETSSTILNIHRKRKIKFIGDRNRTLFLWLNITDRYLILRYFFLLPFSMLWDIVSIRKYKFVGFFWALRYLSQIPPRRRFRKKIFRKSDQEVFEKFSC